MKKFLFLWVISVLGAAGCFSHPEGNEPVNPSIPRKLVIAHTTDSHAKYFPFWIEPNVFDRDMSITSKNPPCWDLNWSGGASYCDGAWIAAKQRFKVWENSQYVYLTEEEMAAKGYPSEDFNRDGICDIQDCQRCWDTNRDNACAAEEDADGDKACTEKDCELRKDIPAVGLCWDRSGSNGEPQNGVCDPWEDLNRDHKCGFSDCVMVWDKNHNFVCDYRWSEINMTFIDAAGNMIDPNDAAAYTKAAAESEDSNRDGVCDSRDYHPGLANTGGVARVMTEVRRIQEENINFPFLQLDSGDAFQGAPQFNLFKGELEMLTHQIRGIDAVSIGNHEFDNGTKAFVTAYKKYSNFPLLASNYLFDSRSSIDLANLVAPSIVLHRGDLRIGIIGIGNDSSLTSLGVIGNSLGFYAIDPKEAAKTQVEILRPGCDLIIILSHLGLDGDYELAQTVPGVDLILGGHHHVVLDPVKVLKGADTDNPREVLVVHSGVDYKVIGELQLIIQDKRIAWYDYVVHPITESIPEDPVMSNMTYAYAQSLTAAQDLLKVMGRAKYTINRIDPTGGDSPLGNIVTDAMKNHELAQADFAVTNSMGIRADIPAGDITREKLYEVFPFENSITVMDLSGNELKELFDFVARKSASRGCVTQVQASGIHVEIDCSPDKTLVDKYGSYALTKELVVNGDIVIKDYVLQKPLAMYKMATNDYMARGGSGFDMLKTNPTRLDTSMSIRDAVGELIENKGEIDPNDYTSERTGEKRIQMNN